MGISWVYKPIEKYETKDIRVELYEHCSKYHVRLYGFADNYVDVLISVDLHKCRYTYEALKILIKGDY